MVWSCFPRDSQESSPAPQFESINSLAFSLLYGLALISIHDYWKDHSLDNTWFILFLNMLVVAICGRLLTMFLCLFLCSLWQHFSEQVSPAVDFARQGLFPCRYRGLTTIFLRCFLIKMYSSNLTFLWWVTMLHIILILFSILFYDN